MTRMRSKDEIYEQMDLALQAMEEGSQYPGMTYEEGVIEALRWVLGDGEEGPMEG